MRALCFLLLLAACGGHAAPKGPVAPAPPPKDDGEAARAGGASGHSAALEQLKVAAIRPRADKQNAVIVPLPDAEHWTRVRFLTLKSLVGFRYGKEHHAIVGGFVTHVEDNSVQGACTKSFETWAAPWIDAFEVELQHDAPVAFAWSPPAKAHEPAKVAIVDLDPLRAKTATVLARGSYEAAWGAYPVWGGKACLVLGVAIPSREDPQRAREVRDRFVRDVFPKVAVTGQEEPKERF